MASLDFCKPDYCVGERKGDGEVWMLENGQSQIFALVRPVDSNESVPRIGREVAPEIGRTAV